jgi:hypothetical protein
MTQAAGDTDISQAFRARNKLIAAVRTLLKGSGLDIRELTDELVISHPGHPEYGRIYITYTKGDVTHRRTIWDYLGNLDNHPHTSPDTDPRITAATIIRLLTWQPDTPT